MKVVRFFVLEVRCQENISEIFGGKMGRRMKNLALCSCAVLNVSPQDEQYDIILNKIST